MKQKHKIPGIKIAMSLIAISLWLCGSSAPKPSDKVDREIAKQFKEVLRYTHTSAMPNADEALSETEELSEAEPVFDSIPELPATGEQLSDFVIPGWMLIDHVILDFNEDGMDDYVGVLQYDLDAGSEDEKEPYWRSRILFAVVSEEPGKYKLDFQDVNLIRAASEGGVFGDPYQTLTAEGRSFTTNSFGGSAWKWSEAYTYTYDNGIWYLTESEETAGYGPYITKFTVNDYESGIGVRNIRSDNWEDMEENLDEDGGMIDSSYDLSYEIKLDEPITIYQAGMRWWLSPDRVAGWPVESVKIADGVDISQEVENQLYEIKNPMFNYIDENYVIYQVSDQVQEKHYLVKYDRKDRTLAVLAQESTAIDEITLYQGRIYYTTELIEEVSYRENEGTVVRSEEQIGMRLYSIGENGTDRRAVFMYRIPESENEIMENKPPYISFMIEISGGEIVTEAYIGDQPHPFYRMNLDGSGVQLIGTMP